MVDGATTDGAGVRVERAGPVAHLVLDGAGGAAGLVAALGAATTDLRFATDVRVVVVRGAGPDFLADDGDPIRPDDGATRSDAERIHRRYDDVRRVQEVVTALADLPQPVLAAVRGRCTGLGLELALAADVRFAATDATFALPGVRRGAPVTALGEVRLAAEVGPGMAKLLALTGRTVAAAEASRIGLVQQVVAPDELDGVVAELAEGLARNAPLAVQGIKRTVGFWAGQGLSEVARFAAASAAFTLVSDDHARAVPPYTGS